MDSPEPAAPPESSARVAATAPLPAGLVYVTDAMPGLTRVRRGTGFSYRDAAGCPVRDEEVLARIRKLAIPPAYTRVWISRQPNGHIQATGFDARGRKQYRYHADWHRSRSVDKFERMSAFGRALPRIRARVARDLRRKPGEGRLAMTRERVLATLVRLLDTTFIRVGNDEYARSNGSYGLTTLRNPHAKVRGSVLQLRFRGKSGVMHSVTLDDAKVAEIVRRCQHLPGQDLFQYETADGDLHSVGSGDVNDYLADAAGGERFTAKDFRTWHGTVQALELTRRACDGDIPELVSGKHVLAEVARRLGNTPAVCRKAYIHPQVLELGTALGSDDETLRALWPTLGESQHATRGLEAAEWRLLRFLEKTKRVQRAAARNAVQRRASDAALKRAA